MRPVYILGVAFSLLLLIPSSGWTEIPNLTRDALEKSASCCFEGVVQNIYERTEREQNYEYRHRVAEIAVRRVIKGTDIAAGDRVFVRYWRRAWIGSGPPPPSHSGHRSLPEKLDTVEVYVQGDRRKGYDVISPNGFFQVTHPKPIANPSRP